MKEYNILKKSGFQFDPNDSRAGLSATKVTSNPWNSDSVYSLLGKKVAKYFVDIKVKDRDKVGYKASTKGGQPDYKIRYSFDKSAIVNYGRIDK